MSHPSHSSLLCGSPTGYYPGQHQRTRRWRASPRGCARAGAPSLRVFEFEAHANPIPILIPPPSHSMGTATQQTRPIRDTPSPCLGMRLDTSRAPLAWSWPSVAYLSAIVASAHTFVAPTSRCRLHARSSASLGICYSSLVTCTTARKTPQRHVSLCRPRLGAPWVATNRVEAISRRGVQLLNRLYVTRMTRPGASSDLIMYNTHAMERSAATHYGPRHGAAQNFDPAVLAPAKGRTA